MERVLFNFYSLAYTQRTNIMGQNGTTMVLMSCGTTLARKTPCDFQLFTYTVDMNCRTAESEF